jgi:hypothetical protein
VQLYAATIGVAAIDAFHGEQGLEASPEMAAGSY